MTQPEVEPNEQVVARASEVLASAQSGKCVGILCVCFMDTGAINVQVAGEQGLIVRLGALSVAADAIKLLETQMQLQRSQQPANWGPGGNA
jgi:hypothetical protein